MLVLGSAVALVDNIRWLRPVGLIPRVTRWITPLWIMDYLSDAFSILCRFFPGLVVSTVVVTVIVHVTGVAGVAYLLVPCSFVFGFFTFVFSFTFCAFFFLVILISGVVLVFFTIAFASFFRWCPYGWRISLLTHCLSDCLPSLLSGSLRAIRGVFSF